MENTYSRSLVRAMYLLRGIGVFALFFLMRFIIFILTMNVANDKDTQIFTDFPLWSVCLIVLLGSLLMYNSLVRHFRLYNVQARNEYLENLNTGKRFSEYRQILKTPEFLLETCGPIALFSLFAPFGAFSEAEFLFQFAGGFRYVLIYATYITAFLFINLNAQYETHRHWSFLHETRSLDMLNSRWRFALKLAFILLIYPFTVPLSPVLVFLCINVYTVVSAVLGLFSTAGLFVFIFAVLFFVLAYPKLRALSTRRKFIKRLKASVERSDYELFDLRSEKGFKLGKTGALRFTLKYGEKIYSCRLLPIEKRRTPLYFTSEKNAHFLYKLGGKKHFVSLARHFDYGVEGDGKAILILAPEPKYVFISSDGSEKRLFTGDRMWRFTVFESDCFFGAMDRHCLDKTNSSFD